MAILLSNNIAQCDDRAAPFAVVGWAWTGRYIILDEALGRGVSISDLISAGYLSVLAMVFSSVAIPLCISGGPILYIFCIWPPFPWKPTAGKKFSIFFHKDHNKYTMK